MKGKCEKMMIVFFLLFSNCLLSQTMQPSLITKQAAISSFSRHHPDLLSSISDPASLNGLRSSAIVVAAERRYLLPELNNYTMDAGIILPAGRFAIAGNYSGFADYHESQVSISYARGLGNKIDAGIQLKYFQLSQAEGYGSLSIPGFVIGTIWHVNEKLHTGVAADHLGKMRFEWGIGYEASQQFLFSFIIEKEEEQPVNVLCGLMYSPVKRIFIKAGISTSISSLWFTVGISLSQIRVEIFSAWHQQLGITPGMILLFEKKQKAHE